MTSRRALQRSLRTTFTPTLRDRLGRVALRLRQASHLPALLAGAKVERPILIIGAPRSGTSLLFSILRQSLALAHWPGESHEVWEADYHPALRGWDSNALDAADVIPDAAERIKRSFFLVAGSKRLIDKAPRNTLRVPFVEAIFPDATYIFLRRDGRDNVNSLINAWRTPRYRTYLMPEPLNIPGVDPHWWKFVLYPGWREDTNGPLEVVCARQWTISNELALDAAGKVSPDRWIDVRYEDFVDDPVAVVGHVIARLGLPFEDAVRRRAAAASTTPINIVTPPERGKWKRENPKEIGSILPLIAPVMVRLGYDRSVT